MQKANEPGRVAEAIRGSISLLVRRLRQLQTGDDITLPEMAALKRLDIGGPMTASALAKLEQISAQSMGATVNKLHERGWVQRLADPDDGRQTILSLTRGGRDALRSRRSARVLRLSQVLTEHFSRTERDRLMSVAPLLERLAQLL